MSATVPATDEARELLVDLVSIPSPSGEEAEAAERLVAFFEEHGREASLDAVGNVRAPGDDAVLLTSHVDTVAGEIPVRIEEGVPAVEAPGNVAGDVLWGRGSVDATGALVAMAAVAVRTGVSFAGVVREETDSAGARHLVADRDPPDALVNGEPSGWDAFALGYRGYLPATYRVETESAHASRPEPNAVQHATAWWEAVEAAVAEVFGGPIAEAFGGSAADSSAAGGMSGGAASGDSVFESVTATPLSFDGGLDPCGHTVAATVEAEFRLPPGVDSADVQGVVADVTDAGSVEWGEPTPPAMASPRTPVARAFRKAVRAEGGEPTPLRKTGTADVNIYADAWDCPTATYGPGDSALDHAPAERLSLAEFDRAVGVLERVARDLTDRDTHD